VRILPHLNDGLTAAVERTGLGPQDVVDQALREWLGPRGFLAEQAGE